MELNREERQNLHAAEVILRCATAKTGGLYALHITRKVICRSRPSCTQNLITSPPRTWDPSPRHFEGRSAFLRNPFALDFAPMINPWTYGKEYSTISLKLFGCAHGEYVQNMSANAFGSSTPVRVSHPSILRVRDMRDVISREVIVVL